jgi:hypothetical protein
VVQRIYILLFLAAFGIFVVRATEAFDLESVQGVWLFDEGDGNEVLDSSGKEHNGTITANDVKRVDGKFGDALEFFGGGKVVVPHADGFTTPTFTIMAWINVPTIPNDWSMMLVGKDGWPERNYAMYVTQASGALHFAFCAPGQQDVGNMNSNQIIADGEWHHVAMTYDLEMRRIYIDGVLDTEAASNAEPCENTVDIEIGRGPVGTMDEVLIANEAFSAGDIQRAMESGLKKFIGGGAAVSASEKLVSAWGAIKAGN